MGAWFGFLTLSLTAVCAANARADVTPTPIPQPNPAWLVMSGAADSLAPLRRDASQWLEQQAVAVRPVELEPQQSGLMPAHLRVLEEAEHALQLAREHTARLEEHEALALLVRAEQALLAQLDIPGAHAWLSELWLAMAIVAAQRDQPGLSMTWLARAASVDPERRVGAAEASPSFLSLAQGVERARDAAARSRFRVEITPAEARVFIDGESVDLTRELALAPGLHVLRATAPGYRPYAALLDALEGTRAVVRVQLSEAPGTTLRRRLAVPALDPVEAEQLSILLSAETQAPVWVFEAGVEGRAFAVLCQATGCVTKAALERDRTGKVREASIDAPTRAWLWESSAPVHVLERDGYGKLWPWLAASTALVLTAVVTSLAVREPGVRHERELIVDPGPAR